MFQIVGLRGFPGIEVCQNKALGITMVLQVVEYHLIQMLTMFSKLGQFNEVL
jgi:hypothetical protein